MPPLAHHLTLAVGLLAAITSPAGGVRADPAAPDPAELRARALDRYAAGDLGGVHAPCESALALPGADELACRLLLAAAYLAEDRPADAARVVEPARGKLGVLDPYAELLSGEALARLGNDAATARLDAAVAADPRGPLWRAAAVPQAIALARKGKLPEARRRLRSAGAADPAVELALGDATVTAGAAAAAIPIWQSLLRDHPASPEAPRAEARIAALAARGVAVPAPPAADRLSRAQGLLDAGLAERVVQETQGWSDEDTAPAAAFLRAQALFALGRGPEAQRALGPCTGASVPVPIATQALELAGRIAMRAGRVDEALADLDHASSQGGSWADDAAFLAAFFAYDAGRFDEAVQRFRRYGSERPRAGRQDEAGFWVGFCLYKLGNFAGAAAELERVTVRFQQGPTWPQARYWRSRALARAGDEATARSELMTVARQAPAGWYGLWARQRLGAEAPSAPEPRSLAASPQVPRLVGIQQARMERARALYAAGLGDLAGEELSSALAGEHRAEVLAMAGRLAFSSRDFGRAFRLGVDRLGGLFGAADLSYPQAFPDAVSSASRTFGVEEPLVWSIMRRESNFRPHVRSAAAAVGLMQLLPRTAEKIGAVLGLSPGIASRLDDPAVNVTLAAWYLSELSGRCKASVALTAASYNAGPPAVAAWLADPNRRELPLDEFVDSIPFKETRGYVKAVVADVDVYRRMSGLGPLQLTDGLPALAPGADF